MSSTIEIDEFGRDLSLKPKQYDFKFELSKYLDRFRGMSWAEICYLVEDEEEEMKKQAEREEFRQTLAERKKLVQQGLYELEDGEVVDL